MNGIAMESPDQQQHCQQTINGTTSTSVTLRMIMQGKVGWNFSSNSIEADLGIFRGELSWSTKGVTTEGSKKVVYRWASFPHLIKLSWNFWISAVLLLSDQCTMADVRGWGVILLYGVVTGSMHQNRVIYHFCVLNFICFKLYDLLW
jgi:hypothetical protein